MRSLPLVVLASLTLSPAFTMAQGGKDGHVVGTERAPGAPQPAQPATPALTPFAHVEQRGTGPVDLVLIPGLACDWRVFDAFMDRNKDKYRMWAVTLPGFGGSAPPPVAKDAKLADRPWLNNAEAGVLELLREKKLDKPFIVGHSLGGHIAMRLATRHSDKLRGAIAIDALPLFPPRLVPSDEDETPERRETVAQSQNEVMRLIPPENWARQQAGGMQYLVKNADRAKELADMCSKVPRDTTIQYMCEMMISDLRKDLQSVKVPVLDVIALSLEMGPDGAKEHRRMVSEQFAGVPAGVQVVFFQDSRHFVMDDRPTELDAAIAAFTKGEQVAESPPPTSGHQPDNFPGQK